MFLSGRASSVEWLTVNGQQVQLNDNKYIGFVLDWKIRVVIQTRKGALKTPAPIWTINRTCDLTERETEDQRNGDDKLQSSEFNLLTVSCFSRHAAPGKT